jgi:hypothetical protein
MAEDVVAFSLGELRQRAGSIDSGRRARLDQLHSEVRDWAESLGINPYSYDFLASWSICSRVVRQLADEATADEPAVGVRLDAVADLVVALGLWGAVVAGE